MSKEVIRPEDFCYVQKSKSLQLAQDEAVLEVTQEQQDELAALYSGMFDNLIPGRIVTGKVVNVDSDGVLIDVGYKSHGFIPKYEFGAHELKELKEGDELEVALETLENPYGSIVLSYEKAKVKKAWGEIVKMFEENKPVQGTVTHKVKGGLSVDIGIPAFLPGSQIDLQRVTDFDEYLGQTVTANILKINQKRGNVIISRRKYLSDQRADLRQKVFDTIDVGQVVKGIVKNITNYGVFVDIGGVDGLLHITDMQWGRISHPSEMVNIGEEISVKILSIDKENQRISLDLKQLTENPWEKISDKLKIGDSVKGKVSSIADYGLFVEVSEGVEGLVHISEISWTDRIADPADHFKVSQEIDVKIVSLDLEKNRMSLSIKQLQGNPWEDIDKKFEVGQKVDGSVSNITDFGVFVRLMPGIDGLVHISDLSWTEHIGHPSERYSIGQDVKVVVLGIDKDARKVSLGIKQLQRDPWDNVEELYPVDSIIEGTVSKITNFGAFIKLESGIEGLLHNAVLTEDEGKRADEMFKVNEKVNLRVINVSKKEHRLGLSTNLEARGRRESKPSTKEKAASSKAAPAAPKMDKPKELQGSLQAALKGAMEKQSADEKKKTKDDAKKSTEKKGD